MKRANEIKTRQVEFVNRHIGSLQTVEYEGNYYHDYFRGLPFIALRQLLQQLDIDLSGKTVLIAGCGVGTDVYYLRKTIKADLTVCDISEAAVQLTLKLHPDIKGEVQDIENLGFADESFDYVFVAATLHHLPRPMVGLYELLRVARYGVIGIEPNDSWLTRVATRLKIAREFEEAGNYVYRFNDRDIQRVSQALFYKSHYVRLFATHRVAKNAIEFGVLKVLNSLGNLLAPALGNYIVFFIRKT